MNSAGMPAACTGSDADARAAFERAGSVCARFLRRVAQDSGKPALREKRLGIWRSITWAEYGERARSVGVALMELGFEPGERACIIGDNCPEWLYADLGILGAGGVSVGIYTTNSARQVEYVMADCGARIIFVEDEEQLDKVLAVRERLPALHRIVVFDTKGLRGFSDPMVTGFADFQDLGRAESAAAPGAWERRIEALQPQDPALIIYTSGTTGAPKGAVLSHGNIAFQVESLFEAMPIGEGDEQLSFLALAHIAERLLSDFCPIYNGSVISFAESPETVPENIREIAPTVLFAVPRIWEKFYSAVRIASEDAGRIQRFAWARALALGERVAGHRLAGRPVPGLLRLAFAIAGATVLGRAKKLIGIHRARYVVTGAAPIAPDLIRWYLALGIDMREGFGLTETSGVATMSRANRRKMGTVGQALPRTQIRISPEGEILIRGGHVFQGYFNDPERTRQTIIDGWLHTGDVGTLDDEGFLRITDRMKDIIITAGGKNITPSEIENQLKFSPFIADAIVIGDRRKFLACLIMIDHENVAKFAQSRGVPFSNYASLCRAREVVGLIQGEIDRVNRDFARVEQIKKFRLIDIQLTPEDEELTPTMKLKRKLVSEKYGALIETMYRET